MSVEKQKMLLATPDKRKTSIIWQYFTETDSRCIVQCNHCKTQLSIAGGSTGNLRRHMKLKHSTIWNQKDLNEALNAASVIAREINESSSEPAETILEIQCDNSVDLSQADDKAQTVKQESSMAYYLMEPIDVLRGKEIDKQLLKIVVKDLHPFSIIENQEFISLVSMLNPNYTLPSHKSLSEDLLLQVYESKKEELRCSLKDSTAVALTTERWTSINHDDVVAVTAHYLNKNLELQSSMLDCTCFSLDYDSHKVALFLQDSVSNWKLSNKIVAVVTENSECMVEAVRQCGWEHIPCFAHTLNKTAKSGLADIKYTIEKVRNTIEYFKRNLVAMSRLCAYQSEAGINDLKLKIDSPVGWNSTFDMLTRFIKNKEPIMSVIQELQVDSFEISSSEWTILEKAVKLLIPFNGVTVEICSEENVPLSKVPHMTRFMMKHVTNILEQQNLPPEIMIMGNTLKVELGNNLKIVETNDVISQSVLLDPRLKKRGFLDSSFEDAYLSLQRKIASLKKDKTNKGIVIKQYSSQSEADNTKQSEYFIDMWSEFRENNTQPPEQNFIPVATVEIDAFMSEAYMDMKSNPAAYWTNILNQNKFPTLFELVKSRLCIPATCALPKNLFSKAGNALLEKRKFVVSGKFKEILFLHKNL